MNRLRRISMGSIPMEAWAWVLGLALVATLDPDAPGWFTVCPFDWIGDALGTAFCPGCGLGRAIGHLARGQWTESWAAHPLAVPAVALLVVRSATLIRRALSPQPPTPHVPNYPLST